MVYFLVNVKGLVILMNWRVSRIIYLLPLYVTVSTMLVDLEKA